MSKKTDSIRVSANPDPLLPKSREALSLLIRAIEKVLDFLEPAHQRQRMRLAELQKAFKDPMEIVRRRPFLNAIREANEHHFAQAGPSASAVFQHLDDAQVKLAMERHAIARSKLVLPAGSEAGNVQAWRPAAAALAKVLEAERSIIELIRDLQQRTIRALDACAEIGEDSADKSADTGRSKCVRLPENPAVVHLAKKINDQADQETSKVSIAIQFTEGDEKKARSLLRQLRRYPHLLRNRKS